MSFLIRTILVVYHSCCGVMLIVFIFTWIELYEIQISICIQCGDSALLMSSFARQPFLLFPTVN